MSADQEDIAAAGDVVLVVGGIDKAQRLRVSSTALSAVSPVFKALLRPHLREGQQARSSTSPVEVSLPDDDPLILSYICNMLHLRHVPALSNYMFSNTLYKIAVAVDQYDCCDALRLQTRAMLLQWQVRNSTNRIEVSELADAVAAAYLLSEPQSFKDFTGKLISHTDGSIVDIRKRDGGKAIPLETLCVLSEKRETARRTLIKNLLSCSKCDLCGKTDYGGFLDATAKALGSSDWPPDFTSYYTDTIRGFITKLQHTGDYRFSCCIGAKATCKAFIPKSRFVSLAIVLDNLCTGFCLQYVREGKPDLAWLCNKHV